MIPCSKDYNRRIGTERNRYNFIQSYSIIRIVCIVIRSDNEDSTALKYTQSIKSKLPIVLDLRNTGIAPKLDYIT